jgi:hypothetical protein
MPHVVKVSPRRHALLRRSTAEAIRARVNAVLCEYYQPEYDPRWRRVFTLYPNEQSLRRRGY